MLFPNVFPPHQRRPEVLSVISPEHLNTVTFTLPGMEHTQGTGASLRQRLCRAGGAPLLQVQGVTEVTRSHSSHLNFHRVVKTSLMVGWRCPKKGIHVLQLPGFTEGGTSCVKFLPFFFVIAVFLIL